MTEPQFQNWKKNGNLLFKSLEIYQSLDNDLAEGVKLSQRNLLELAKYLQLCVIEENNKNRMLKLEVLGFALAIQKK